MTISISLEINTNNPANHVSATCISKSNLFHDGVVNSKFFQRGLSFFRNAPIFYIISICTSSPMLLKVTKSIKQYLIRIEICPLSFGAFNFCSFIFRGHEKYDNLIFAHLRIVLRFDQIQFNPCSNVTLSTFTMVFCSDALSYRTWTV